MNTKQKNIDILFIGSHPDDCEIFCGGTLFHFKSQKKKIGIVDLTLGEVATYGTIEDRQKEVQKANSLISLNVRENLKFPDSYLEQKHEMIDKIVATIRKYRPEIIFTFGKDCRHPDHAETHFLVKKAFFLAGLKKRKIQFNGFDNSNNFPAHRCEKIFFFGDFNSFQKPDFVIDISKYWQQKIKLLQCYDSQILSPNSKEKNEKTFVHSKQFWDYLETNARVMGSFIGKNYGEGFFCEEPLEIKEI